MSNPFNVINCMCSDIVIMCCARKTHLLPALHL